MVEISANEQIGSNKNTNARISDDREGASKAEIYNQEAETVTAIVKDAYRLFLWHSRQKALAKVLKKSI